MSRRTEQRLSIANILSAHVLQHGLEQTSLRQLAKAAAVSDRMLLYYFEDKFDVMETVMQLIASTFTQALDEALPSDVTRSVAEVFEEIILLSNSPDVQPFMSIWIEAIAAASRGNEPYKTTAAQIASGFLGWIESRLPLTKDAPKHAAMVLAMIEGIAVLNACTDVSTQQQAIDSFLDILRTAQP